MVVIDCNARINELSPGSSSVVSDSSSSRPGGERSGAAVVGVVGAGGTSLPAAESASSGPAPW